MDPVHRPCAVDVIEEKVKFKYLKDCRRTLSSRIFTIVCSIATIDVSEMTNQCESDSFQMIRSGEDLSPGSSQFGIASDAEPRAITSS